MAYHRADELIVLRDAESVERGSARDVIEDPDVRWVGAAR
jgi:ABC-type antimicrobial peptide transport system ATPase subunit